MKTEIFADRAAFEERTDKDVNGVTRAFANANPGWDTERGNEGCWYCSDCSDCSDCLDCSDCYCCACCSDLMDRNPRPRKASGGEG